MSHHREQLESSLQRAIGQLLSEGLNDPRVRGLVSVTGVKVSLDGRHANVGVSVLPAEHEQVTLHGLRAAGGHIRSLLGTKLKMRSAPMLHFELDTSIKKQAAVLAAIDKATREQKDRPETDNSGDDLT